MYAKPIDKGISRYDLSEEEKETLRTAMSNEIIANKTKKKKNRINKLKTNK